MMICLGINGFWQVFYISFTLENESYLHRFEQLWWIVYMQFRIYNPVSLGAEFNWLLVFVIVPTVEYFEKEIVILFVLCCSSDVHAHIQSALHAQAHQNFSPVI